MLKSGSFWFYAMIFIGEAIYLMLSTIRVVLMGNGKRTLAVAVCAVEVVMWLIITSTVIRDVRSDPLKIIVYCLAFSTGILLGTSIQKRLGGGYVLLKIEVSADEAETLAHRLWDAGFGVTMLDGCGGNREPRNIVFTEIRRRRLADAKKIISANVPDSLVSIHDMGYLSGGFVR